MNVIKIDVARNLKTVRARAARAYVTLPDDVANFIAEQARSDVEAERITIRILAFASVTGRDVSFDLAWDVYHRIDSPVEH